MCADLDGKGYKCKPPFRVCGKCVPCFEMGYSRPARFLRKDYWPYPRDFWASEPLAVIEAGLRMLHTLSDGSTSPLDMDFDYAMMEVDLQEGTCVVKNDDLWRVTWFSRVFACVYTMSIDLQWRDGLVIFLSKQTEEEYEEELRLQREGWFIDTSDESGSDAASDVSVHAGDVTAHIHVPPKKTKKKKKKTSAHKKAKFNLDSSSSPPVVSVADAALLATTSTALPLDATEPRLLSEQTDDDNVVAATVGISREKLNSYVACYEAMGEVTNARSSGLITEDRCAQLVAQLRAIADRFRNETSSSQDFPELCYGCGVRVPADRLDLPEAYCSGLKRFFCASCSPTSICATWDDWPDCGACQSTLNPEFINIMKRPDLKENTHNACCEGMLEVIQAHRSGLITESQIEQIMGHLNRRLQMFENRTSSSESPDESPPPPSTAPTTLPLASSADEPPPTYAEATGPVVIGQCTACGGNITGDCLYFATCGHLYDGCLSGKRKIKCRGCGRRNQHLHKATM